MSKILVVLLAALTLGAAAERRIEVSSDEVEYSADGSNALFSGNVQVNAGGIQIQSAVLEVQKTETGNIYTARADTTPVLLLCTDCADYPINADAGKSVVFSDTGSLQLAGGIVLCADTDCREGKLTADSADWQPDAQRLHLIGAPFVDGVIKLQDSDELLYIKTKDLQYNNASGDAILTGASSIKRGDNNITGDIIRTNVKTGALKAEAATDKRVQATFGGDD